MRVRKAALVFCAALLLSGTAYAQINTELLSDAQAYDVGALQTGGFASGFDSALWQGVSAQQATALIEKIDVDASRSARELIRAALLSGGVPPQAGDGPERETYMAARLSAVLGLGDLAAFDRIAEQSGINRASPVFTKIFTERALTGGDISSACAITDNVTIERKSPYWAKLRAFCHVVRNEIPAAELTSDLLARSGHKDKTFFDLLGKLTGTRPEIKVDSLNAPLQIAMYREIFKAETIELKKLPVTISAAIAMDTKQSPDDRLEALFAASSTLSTEQIRAALGSLADGPPTSAEQLAEKDWDAGVWGGAYIALTNSNDINDSAALAGAILAQADKQNLLAIYARALETETGIIPVDVQAKYYAGTFTQAAVMRGDINTLRGIFQALDSDNPLRGRIALASDALGNGFMLGELGVDIETRLALTDKKDNKAQARAVRDTYIAVAMGANLSDTAEQVLRGAKLKGSTVRPGALLALHAAARRGSKAETALRAAPMIEGKPLRADDFATLLTAMTNAGMHEQAGKLAALDILRND